MGRCRSPKRKSVFRSQVANTTYAHYTVLEGSRCLDTARQSVSVSLGRISFVDFVTSTCRTDDDRTPCKPTQDKSSEKSVVLLMLRSLCPLAIREAGKGGGGDFRNFCRAPPPESGLVAPLGGARASCQRGGEQEGARGTNLKQWRTQRFYKFTSSLYLSHPNSQR